MPKREKPKKPKRIAYLYELLEAVFYNHGVNYEEDDGMYSVITRPGIYGKKSYSNAIKERCYKLFEIALLGEDVDFRAIKRHVLSKEVILENCTEYFRTQGIDVDGIYQREKHDIFLPKVYLKAMGYVISAIFTDLGEDEDNISLGFEKAIREIKGLLIGFELGIMVHDDVKVHDIMQVFDSQYIDDSEHKFNYAIPFNTLRNRIVISYLWCVPQIIIKEAPKNTVSPNPHSFDEMIKGYLTYPFQENQLFVDQSQSRLVEYIQENCKEHYYSISHVKIESVILPRDFYYISYLDPSISVIKLKQCTTHEQLDEWLQKKACEDLKKKYIKELKKYYASVIAMIEDILDRMLSDDLTALVEKQTQNYNECKHILDHFNIDSSEMLSVLMAEYGNSEMIFRAYDYLEEAICCFVSNLKGLNIDFITELKKLYGGIEIEEHRERIKRCLMSDRLKLMINLREQAQAAYPERFEINIENRGSSINPVIFDLRHQNKNFYQHLYDSLKQYYDFLV